MSAMSRAAEGSEFTLRIGDNDAATVRFVNPEDVERILAVLKRGAASVSLTPREDTDVEGHAATGEVIIDARFDDDDTEGHAIALKFPTAQDARDFQMKILAAGLLAGTIVVAGIGATAQPFASTDVGTGSASSGAAGLVDQRAGEIGLGSITSPSSGLSDQRAGEIGLGSVAAPGSGAGLAEHRAGEIGLGSVAAPGSGAGLAEHRAGEIGLGSVPAPGSGAGLAEQRAGEIGAGGATGAAGLADQRAGEIGLGSVAAPGTDFDAHRGYQQAPSLATDDADAHRGYQQAPSQAVDEADAHRGYQQAPSQAPDEPDESTSQGTPGTFRGR
jgi:hypothetical protein